MNRGLSPLIKPLIWYSMAYSMLVIVAILSLVPAPVEMEMDGSDKIMHFTAYWGLSVCFSILVQKNISLFVVAFGLISYGILIEFLQGLTGYRMLDSMDMLANSAGVICGLFVRLTPLPEWLRTTEILLFKPVDKVAN